MPFPTPAICLNTHVLHVPNITDAFAGNDIIGGKLSMSSGCVLQAQREAGDRLRGDWERAVTGGEKELNVPPGVYRFSESLILEGTAVRGRLMLFCTTRMFCSPLFCSPLFSRQHSIISALKVFIFSVNTGWSQSSCGQLFKPTQHTAKQSQPYYDMCNSTKSIQATEIDI